MDNSESLSSGESTNSTPSAVSPPTSPISSSKMDAEEAEKYPVSSNSPVSKPSDSRNNELLRIPEDFFGLYGVRVYNIDDSISEVDLSELFSDAGRVATIKMHKTALNIPMAFVKFNTEKEARTGIEKYDGFVFKGKKLQCAPAFISRKKTRSLQERYGNSMERRFVPKGGLNESDTGYRPHRNNNNSKEFHSKVDIDRRPHPSSANNCVRKSESDGLLISCKDTNDSCSKSLVSPPRSDSSHQQQNGINTSPLQEKMENLHVNTNDLSCKDIHRWTVEDVVSYFKGTECSDFAEFFRIEEIDGGALVLLDRATLCDHMKLGPALKIINIINKLKCGE